MASDRVRNVLAEVTAYLENLSEQERAEIEEIRFTATKKATGSDVTTTCFSLVAAVPFASDEQNNTRAAEATAAGKS